jgi:hypothetical protein
MTMRYIDVAWHHDHPKEPVRLVSEIDADGFEIRKLEFFRDGRVQFACNAGGSGDTRLGEAPVPPLSEINKDPEFEGVTIDPGEFARLWGQHVD